MSYTFRPAVRENVGLFIGLAGGTSSGKTMSAMRMAQGIVGRQNKFAVVDTENGRARHYAPRPGEEPDFVHTFRFDVFELFAPFESERYGEAAKAAVAAGYKAVVVDSATHEHDGEGGYLDMQAKDLEQRVERYMKKYPNSKEYEVIEKLTPSSWIAPKRQRKRMMQTLLACSTSVPIIFCFRAEEKVFATKDGKLVAHNPPVWAPICGKGMPFEMTVFFLLRKERPGVPEVIKLQEQHKALFPLDKPLDEESGKRIARWASGGGAPASAQAMKREPASSAPAVSGDGNNGPQYITDEQALELDAMCTDYGISVASLKKKANVERLTQMLAADLDRAKAWIRAHSKEAASQ